MGNEHNDLASKTQEQDSKVLDFDASKITKKDIKKSYNAYTTFFCIVENEEPFSEIIFTKAYTNEERDCMSGSEMEEDFLEKLREEFNRKQETFISFIENNKHKVMRIVGDFEIQMANGDKLIGGYKKEGGYAIWKSGDRFQNIESIPGNSQ